jgi:hypothetical protein
MMVPVDVRNVGGTSNNARDGRLLLEEDDHSIKEDFMNEDQSGVQVNHPTSPHGSVQSSFNLNSNNGADDTAWTDQDVILFEIENSRGDPDQCEVTVSDPYDNNSFTATDTISWQSGDTSIQYIEFSNFPLQADQVTPMDKCHYTMSVTNTLDGSGTEVSVNIYRG